MLVSVTSSLNNLHIQKKKNDKKTLVVVVVVVVVFGIEKSINDIHNYKISNSSNNSNTYAN